MPLSPRTITVIGLSLRDETMIRSLVDLTRGRHDGGWRVVEELDADVALCGPESPLARVAIARGRQSGRPRCVCFGDPGDRGSEYAASLRLPVRVGELWGVLDGLAGAPGVVTKAAVETPGRPRPELAGLPIQQIVAAMRKEHRDGPARWSLRIGTIAFEVSMPERVLQIVSPQDCTFDALVEAASAAPVHSVLVAAGRGVDESRAVRKPLDPLLWRVGLRESGGPAAAWARDATPVSLRRWPDFGHLGAHRPHLAMTSQLTRGAMTPAALAEAVGCDQDQVCAFLNACALLDLVQVESAVEPGGARAGAPVVRPAGGLNKLMRSFRAALGMGG